jgi:hypothetical protein
VADFIRSGKRLSLGKGCPHQLRLVIESTWESDPGSRPDIVHVARSLEEILGELCKGSQQQLSTLNGDAQGNFSGTAQPTSPIGRVNSKCTSGGSRNDLCPSRESYDSRNSSSSLRQSKNSCEMKERRSSF